MNDSDTDPENLSVVVLDTGRARREFPNSRAVWGDYTVTKGHTIYVVDEDGEKHSIPNGTIIYAAQTNCDEIPTFDELEEEHELKFVPGSTMWGED